jgi:hypothetical protein
MPPRRIVGYLDLQAIGGRHDIGVSAGFSLKLPNDRIFGVSAGYLWNGRMMYGARYGIPIKLKR